MSRAVRREPRSFPQLMAEGPNTDQEEVDFQTDVYALGVVLFEVLSGPLPYDVKGKSIGGAIRAICEKNAIPLGSVDTYNSLEEGASPWFRRAGFS